MGSKYGAMSRSIEVKSQDNNLWDLCQNSSFDKFSQQKYLTFAVFDSHVGDSHFHILDRIPLRIFLNPTSSLEI